MRITNPPQEPASPEIYTAAPSPLRPEIPTADSWARSSVIYSLCLRDRTTYRRSGIGIPGFPGTNFAIWKHLNLVLNKETSWAIDNRCVTFDYLSEDLLTHCLVFCCHRLNLFRAVSSCTGEEVCYGMVAWRKAKELQGILQ